MNCIGRPMICKILFCSEFLVITKKVVEKRRRQVIAKHFAFQASAITCSNNAIIYISYKYKKSFFDSKNELFIKVKLSKHKA